MLPKILAFILSVLICVVPRTAKALSEPIVETDRGQVLGEQLNNDGSFYYAFRGIPYAEPPIGVRRFEPPEELHSSWTGALNATQTPSKCMQWFAVGKKKSIIGAEDCLYLNVFTPHLPLNEAELLPVMVFIHGGGFMWGSADFYGERIVMKTQKMLLVTINYRLNALGFLSTEDEAISGNMGLKDQALALKWVHDNVASFGGDKEKVLLAGWSAGGASVHYHMISKMTRPTWFSSAASISGTALCPCHAIYAGEARKKTELIAQYLNCTHEQLGSSQGIKDCLQSKKAEDIIAQVPKFYKFSQHPFAIFGPVIEASSADSSFLSDHVESLMKAGQAKGTIPWLVTRTAEDGAFGTAEFLRKDQNGRELIYELNDRWEELAPILLFFNSSLSPEASSKRAQKVRVKYFGSKNISLETYVDLECLYNDELSISHVEKSVELFVQYTNDAAAYGYVYDNPAPFGFGQIMSQRQDFKFGTLHGDDIFLIFNNDLRKQHPYREDERAIAENLIEMLENFAAKRAPSYAGKTLTKLTAKNNFQFDKLTNAGMNQHRYCKEIKYF